MTEFEYSGTELDIFSCAENWKRYWASLIKPYLGSRVLDVGAGIGSTAKNLTPFADCHWLALEPDANLATRIKMSIKQGDLPKFIEVINGSVIDLNPNQQFDTILYIDVLEHIEDHEAELARVSNHLLPGGHLVILSPAHQWLFTPFDSQVGHFRRYKKRELISIMPGNLTLSLITYIDSVGMLASLANKIILNASQPTIRQIKLWDNYLVPASRIVDKVFCGRLGKSILCVYRRDPATALA